jgi:uncharacterized lipoprotein YehR (DUF1307 family)
MHKIIFSIILFSLSACGGGGTSDEVSNNVGETGIDIDNVYGDFADNVAADAAEEAATAAALKVAEEQATALAAAAALQDAANQAQQSALQKFGTGKFGQSTFQ